MTSSIQRAGRGTLVAGAVTLMAGAVALGAAGCGANAKSSSPSSSSAPSSSAPSSPGSSSSAGAAADSKGTIGVLLPETATSARWESFDKPFLAAALKADGYTADIQNAQGNVQQFSSLADGMIASKVKVLIVASPNAQVGAAVEAKAKQAGIPTIDYDRLNAGGSGSYIVTFDAVKVGNLQAQALVAALKDKRGAQVIQIEGAPDEYNAVQFHKGQMQVLSPLYANGTLKLVRDQFTPNWDNQAGGREFEQILTANGGKVDGVVAANDGMAGAVVTVLQKNHLNGVVPVTGQDATLAGLQSILRGDQTMTVFKAIKIQAQATAQLAADLANGDTAAANAYAKQTVIDPVSHRQVKAVLLQPETVGKDRVKEVVDQGYVTAADLCTGSLGAVCAKLGIS